MTRENVEALIQALHILRDGANDALASKVVSIYPTMKDTGATLVAGTRINWNGSLMRALENIVDNEENTPSASPALWEAVPYKDGYRFIYNTIDITPFSSGECGWWMGKLYCSVIDSNDQTPEQSPDDWRYVNETAIL